MSIQTGRLARAVRPVAFRRCCCKTPICPRRKIFLARRTASRIFDTKGARQTLKISPRSLAALSRRLPMSSLPCNFKSAKIKRRAAREFLNSIRRLQPSVWTSAYPRPEPSLPLKGTALSSRFQILRPAARTVGAHDLMPISDSGIYSSRRGVPADHQVGR